MTWGSSARCALLMIAVGEVVGIGQIKPSAAFPKLALIAAS